MRLSLSHIIKVNLRHQEATQAAQMNDSRQLLRWTSLHSNMRCRRYVYLSMQAALNVFICSDAFVRKALLFALQSAAAQVSCSLIIIEADCFLLPRPV